METTILVSVGYVSHDPEGYHMHVGGDMHSAQPVSQLASDASSSLL